jgi:thiol-disulfide isomerase/thioredoxin
MSAVWPDTFVEESNLSSNISILRKQLGVTTDGGDYIQTIPKRGYRFAAAVKQVQDESPILPIPQDAGSGAAPAVESESSERPVEVHEARTVKDYRGNTLLVNFWATWCAPRNAELPLLVKEEENYKSRGVIFIAASVDDAKSRKQVRAFVSQNQLRLLVCLGATSDDLDRLGMGRAFPQRHFSTCKDTSYSVLRGRCARKSCESVWIVLLAPGLVRRLQPSLSILTSNRAANRAVLSIVTLARW